jgi:CheY-like chemotaxis protein
LCIKCAFNHLLDGAAAVKVLREVFGDNGNGNSAGPDIIFLDLKMPVMSGFEFLEWLKKRSFSAGPSVFVLSGSDQDADRERAAELGATGYLVKPITSERLRACLNTIDPTIQPPMITRPDSAGVESH